MNDTFEGHEFVPTPINLARVYGSLAGHHKAMRDLAPKRKRAYHVEDALYRHTVMLMRYIAGWETGTVEGNASYPSFNHQAWDAFHQASDATYTRTVNE